MVRSATRAFGSSSTTRMRSLVIRVPGRVAFMPAFRCADGAIRAPLLNRRAPKCTPNRACSDALDAPDAVVRSPPESGAEPLGDAPAGALVESGDRHAARRDVEPRRDRAADEVLHR